MGICWPGCMKKRPRRRIVLILIGLDNAGKTQTVNSLAGDGGSVLPTVGFKAVNLVHRDTPVTIFDLGGGPQFRQIWPQYYSEVHGVIFVVDASDVARLDECRRTLEEVISHERISGKPILVLANKQDKRGALDDIDVVEKMNIETLVNRYRCPTLVESYTAAIPEKASKKQKLDPGLKKGYLWLLNYVINRYGDINLRVQTDMHAELERRKRLSAANGASETYTTDDAITGFENPNYATLTRDETLESHSERIRALEEGVIVVKPIAYKSSGDGTVAFDSDRPSDDSDAKTFGRDDPKTPPLSRNVGRLSPIDRVKNSMDRVKNSMDRVKNSMERAKNSSAIERSLDRSDFATRPRSSPSVQVVAADVEINDLDDTVFTEVDLSNGNGEGGNSTIVSEAPKKPYVQIKSEKTTPPVKNVTSESGLRAVVAAGAGAGEAVRPASASQLVRKQLEMGAAPQHRRRLSLRYGIRNKTSPEQLGLFHYEPGSKLDRSLWHDKGDFEASMEANYATQHKDVTL